jgi:hypothetical protein
MLSMGEPHALTVRSRSYVEKYILHQGRQPAHPESMFWDHMRIHALKFISPVQRI